MSNTLILWVQQADFLFPLILTLWIAVGDIRTHRIPNYLTLGIALSGLGYQIGLHGLDGAFQGILGLILGFGLLIIPYLLGGMGAGDVKALAALGAWLGPWHTFLLFCYMALAGGIIALGVLWWRGLLWAKIRQAWSRLLNWLLQRPFGSGLTRASAKKIEASGIPYGVAIALGMLALYLRGPAA